jgi:hypothetical protein
MSREFKNKARRGRPPRPLLYISQILAWADEHFRRTGAWPTNQSGRIPGTLDEKWINIDGSLRFGLSGLRPGSSIARLLAEHRGHRNRNGLPPLPVAEILRWADAFHKLTAISADRRPALLVRRETAFKKQVFPQHHPRRFDDVQDLHGDLAGKRLPDKDRVFPSEVPFPILFSRIEQGIEPAAA